MPAHDTVEAVPASAVSVFGEELDRARRFVGHLATSGVERGLIGPRELPRLWARHVLNCAVLAELLPQGCSLVDIGSGAGLPGVALAIARPDVDVTLVEPLERRTTWLTEVVDDLGLSRVTVRRARAEELKGRLAADVVTARAVAPLERLARWGLPLVAPGGVLLAIKGRSAAEEVEASKGALARLGGTDVEVVTCGDAVLEVPTTVVRVRVGTGVPRAGVGGSGRQRTSRRGRASS